MIKDMYLASPLHPKGTEHPNKGVLLHNKAEIIFDMDICSQCQLA